MKQFMEPEIEIVRFSVLDVITTSNTASNDEIGWIDVPKAP